MNELTPISYCPFCGVKLRPLTEAERHHPYTCATTYGEPCDCEWYAISEGEARARKLDPALVAYMEQPE